MVKLDRGEIEEGVREFNTSIDKKIDKEIIKKVRNLGSRVLRSFEHYHLIFYSDLVEFVACKKQSYSSTEEALSKNMRYVGRKGAKLIIRHLQEQGLAVLLEGRYKQLLLL